MKIVYDDYGGAHSTQVAAAVHLGLLAADRVPSAAELLNLPLFDRVTQEHHGCLIFMGRDNDGHEVFVLGRGPSAVTVERAIASGIALTGAEMPSLRFFETLPTVNWWMRVGGYLSRHLGWVKLGRPLVVYGTRKAFPQLVQLVDQVRKAVAAESGELRLVSSGGDDLGAVAGASVQRGGVPGLTSGL
jgi:hypothetical protein